VARTKNPYGDPVGTYRKRNVWRVRYYPTGLITEPSDRKDLPDSYGSEDAAKGAAEVLRTAPKCTP
jgi:hypothetical protein